ncbi:MAG: MBL fold metallo-hydrolase [Candidatus Marinimicrobia bacterium]|nr:MBL fold metallo-hydrolase [Candidatus Neomarinimicrobiota bacterium]
MYFCNLGSGSKGNSTFVQSNGSGILIDQGFSGKNLIERLSLVDINPKQIQAIVITHEHSDHIKGAGILARRLDIPVFITPDTARDLKAGFFKNVDLKHYNSGDQFQIDDLTLKAFHIPHDANDPVGIICSSGEKKIALATDIGDIRNAVTHFLQDLDLLLLESNHDREMLENGPYPLYLQQRIKSRVGHLSNAQSLQFLSRIKTQNTGLKHLVLGHLSEKNNTVDKVRELFEKDADQNSANYKIHITSQDRPHKIIEI